MSDRIIAARLEARDRRLGPIHGMHPDSAKALPYKPHYRLHVECGTFIYWRWWIEFDGLKSFKYIRSSTAIHAAYDLGREY
jgi:hypothetical protein